MSWGPVSMPRHPGWWPLWTNCPNSGISSLLEVEVEACLCQALGTPGLAKGPKEWGLVLPPSYSH